MHGLESLRHVHGVERPMPRLDGLLQRGYFRIWGGRHKATRPNSVEKPR